MDFVAENKSQVNLTFPDAVKKLLEEMQAEAGMKSKQKWMVTTAATLLLRSLPKDERISLIQRVGEADGGGNEGAKLERLIGEYVKRGDPPGFSISSGRGMRVRPAAKTDTDQKQ